MKTRKFFFWFISLTLPYFLLMDAVFIAFSPWFLSFEYNQASFPEDIFGFTKEDRLKFGTASLLYITRNFSDDFMKELSLSDGTKLYNDRELSHMGDVQDVFQRAKLVWICLIIVYAGIFWLVIKHPDSLQGLLTAIKRGSQLTLLLMAVILLMTVFAFDAMFEAFHGLFFSGGSWLFYINDSLIRLYPEKLWVDAFTLCGGITVFFSIILIYITVKASRRTH